MEKALFKEKHAPQNPGRFAHYPDWTDDFVKTICSGYWSGRPINDPVWEHLASSLVITGIVSDELVKAQDTKGGWRDPAAVASGKPLAQCGGRSDPG
jgi:hypothetical protein